MAVPTGVIITFLEVGFNCHLVGWFRMTTGAQWVTKKEHRDRGRERDRGISAIKEREWGRDSRGETSSPPSGPVTQWVLQHYHHTGDPWSSIFQVAVIPPPPLCPSLLHSVSKTTLHRHHQIKMSNATVPPELDRSRVVRPIKNKNLHPPQFCSLSFQ